MGETKIYKKLVEAGHIAFIKRSFIESFGEPEEGVGYIKVPAGIQEITVTAIKTWVGEARITKVFNLEEDTEFYLGDTCYAIRDENWGTFCDKTNILDDIPATEGFILNTGGDGCFEVRVSMRKLDSESK